MHRMKMKKQKLSRASYAVFALALALAGLAPVLNSKIAHAFPTGGQVQVRSIKMSDSRIGTTTGATVSYQVSFKPASATYNVKGIIVDFCGGSGSDTPIVDDTNCTIPTGFTLGATPTVNVAPTITGYTNLGVGTGSWTSTAQNSGRTLRMVNSLGPSIDPANGTPYTFVVSGVTNPTNVATFYARIITYTSDTGDVLAYTAASAGSTQAKDYGGFALSTAAVVSITAKVQESLTFCVSGAAPGPSCGFSGQAVTPAAITLGHGAANVLDTSAVDTATAFTQLSTNANGGAVIRMRNTAASGGLNSGGNSIPPVGATATAIATTSGVTAAFGMKISAGSGGTGTISQVAPYDTANYGMDATTANDNVLSTYGDSIATAAAPVSSVGNTLTFAAIAANTTPAGLYTANMILIATGTF
jgi:hypothetical protein